MHLGIMAARTRTFKLTYPLVATGRFGWAAASDYLGRKNTYYLFGLSVPILAALPSITTALVDKYAASVCMHAHYLPHMLLASPNPVPLYMFIGGTSLVVSFYAGLFSGEPFRLPRIQRCPLTIAQQCSPRIWRICTAKSTSEPSMAGS